MALIGVTVGASMSLAGCGDEPAATPEPDSTPTGQPSETVVAIDHYNCPIDGYTIPVLGIDGVMEIGGNGQRYEAVCFTVGSQTTVNALVYPLSGDQDQAIEIFRLDPETEGTIPAEIVDHYRVDSDVGDLHGWQTQEMVAAGAYGLLPYLSSDLDPGTYLLVVFPTFDAEFVSTRIAVFADGLDHHDEFLASENPWVVEQATRGRAMCSPEGYNLLTHPVGWWTAPYKNGNEWAVGCFTLEEPTTITAMAYPVSASQDLVLELVSFSPNGQSTLQDVFDQYRTDPSAPVVTFDSVLSADDEIGVLPWGKVDLPAGEYAVLLTPYEAVPLEDIKIVLYSDGEDHIDDFFGTSTNPWVIDQYNAYLGGGSTGD
jgi:hypothetical protein